MHHAKNITALVIATLVTLPGILLHLMPIEMPAPATAFIAGSAILGASFLLLWASEAARKDISQSLALAVIALIAVLPEYAVDMYFTWQAGQNPESGYAQYAIANMTGANRLLIGVAWSLIAVLHWFKSRNVVRLDSDRKVEILFLGMATAYAFLIPVKGNLAWYDGIVFLGLYIWYIRIAARRGEEEGEIEGPAAMLGNLPTARRRAAVISLLLFAAFTILMNAEAFSEGLVATGRLFNINEFLLVQWLAPIASETPEFVVAIMFVMRHRAGVALGSLLSAKLNQWTLLVGMIPGVYALSANTLAHPIPMGSFQMNEILLTAAQSAFAVILLLGMKLGFKEGMLLFVLFIGQFFSPFLLKPIHTLLPGTTEYTPEQAHYLFSMVYLAASAWFFMKHRTAARNLIKVLKKPEPTG